MPLKLTSKLALLSGVPLAGLVLSISASSMMSRTTSQQIRHSKDESAVHASLAQRMQFDVVQIQQWLTDISATRGLDGLNDGFDKADEAKRSFDEGLARFDEMFTREGDVEGRRSLAALRTSIDEFYRQGRAMANAYVADGTAAGNAHMSEFDTASERLQQALTPFIDAQTREFEEGLTALESTSTLTTRALVIGGALLAAFTALLAWRLTRSITMPIRHAVSALSEGAGQTVAAATQVATSAQSLSMGATEQAASLEETSASMAHMAAMTRRNAEHSHQAADQMVNIDRHVAQSNEALGDMVASMSSMQESSAKVSRIIRTIDEIAFQTNILALNAAVEAARAGEAGLGFAVVADEVRTLAQRSAQAARDTSGLIEESIGLAADGATKLDRVAAAIGAITGDVTSVRGLVDQVSRASREQAEGIDQVTQAIAQMEKVTQSTAATAEESAAASEELSAQAETTMGAVRDLAAMVVRSTPTTPEARLPRRRAASSSSAAAKGHAAARVPAPSLAWQAPHDDASQASDAGTGTYGTF